MNSCLHLAGGSHGWHYGEYPQVLLPSLPSLDTLQYQHDWRKLIGFVQPKLLLL
jgi:hypothetical protein